MMVLKLPPILEVTRISLSHTIHRNYRAMEEERSYFNCPMPQVWYCPVQQKGY